MYLVIVVRDLSRLSSLVMSLNRTLIMPAMSCPPSVNTTRCTICAWDDRCAYGFQASIGFRFRAHVEVRGME